MAVSGGSRADRGYALTVDNLGGMAAPVDVRVKYSDGDTATFHQTPAIWESNQKQATVRIPTEKTISSLDLDGGIWMDANTTNNGWTAGGR
jgi:hypothetical protein